MNTPSGRSFFTKFLFLFFATLYPISFSLKKISDLQKIKNKYSRFLNIKNPNQIKILLEKIK